VPLVALGLAACGGANKGNTQNAAAPNAAAPAANSQGNSAATANAQAPSAAGATLTAAEVRTMIERDGAEATVRTLTQGGTPNAPYRFAAVEQGIASGEQAWLDLVPLLLPALDGEVGTGIQMVIGDALPKNAAGVLRLVRERTDVNSFCDDSMSDKTEAERRAYRQSAIAAVEAVTDPALQEAKTNCLAVLRQPASS
jgi:hypothetical protein